MASHKEILRQCKKLIPPLSSELHKGQAGRIGVLGGSKDYSGAPYFASMSTLRLGADLAHVICEPTAGAVIKTYSPDLIVHTDLHDDSTERSVTELLEGLLPRLHTLVIGPGLGRSSVMQMAARTAIRIAREREVYVVIDADGLWLVQNEPDTVRGYRRAVLTPNVVEFARLCEAVGLDHKVTDEKDKLELASRLAKKLGGVTVVQKGASDRITNGDETLVNESRGSERRCGGQGDVLSGSIGTFLAWGANYLERVVKDESSSTSSSGIAEERIPLLAAYAGGTVTRTASRMCFAQMRRAMQTGDMISHIGPAYEEIFEGDITAVDSSASNQKL